jgi:PST family polysaccharide transporter
VTREERNEIRHASAARHLDVAHLQPDLLVRSVRGGLVTLVVQAVKVVAQAGAIVILARLLAPDDFGRFAMVAAFLAALELFKDLGLSTATVQRRDVSLGQLDTLFWLNSGLGVAAAGIMAALAPVLAWLFGEPILLTITPAAAVAFLFTGIAAQHLALLRRQMRFSVLAVIQVAAEVAGLAAAVIAAFAGLGIWALVLQRIFWAMATAMGAWVACNWRPGRPGPFAEVRSFVQFGGNATASMVVSYMAGNLDKVLIGWYWGAAPLGLFERSQKLLLLPIRNLNIPLGNVALAALSRMVDEPARYRNSYLAAVERLAMLITPLGGLFLAGSGPVVALVLGERWSEAAPILAWMGLATIYMPASYALSWLYMSQDRTPEMLRAGLLGAAMAIAAVLCGLPVGPVGVAAAFAVSGLLVRGPVLFWLAGRRGPVRTRDFYTILVAPTVGGAAVAAVVWSIRRWIPLDGLPLGAEVAVLAAASAVTAFLVCLLFPRGRRVVRSLGRLPALLRGDVAGRADSTVSA